MTEQQNTLQQQVIARAMKDEAFRQQLLSNPKETLQSKLGITLPVGVSVHVHENTPTNLHLVLPAKTQTGEPPVKFDPGGGLGFEGGGGIGFDPGGGIKPVD